MSSETIAGFTYDFLRPLVRAGSGFDFLPSAMAPSSFGFPPHFPPRCTSEQRLPRSLYLGPEHQGVNSNDIVLTCWPSSSTVTLQAPVSRRWLIHVPATGRACIVVTVPFDSLATIKLCS